MLPKSNSSAVGKQWQRACYGAPRAAALLLLLSGCTQPLNTMYGRTSGLGQSSVNGTRVLADMFTDGGHKVDSWYRLSPKLEEADVIVWFPDDFGIPPIPVREWLEDWMAGGSDRTLIYVGRDFDAAPGYWKKMAARVPAGEQQRVAAETTLAEGEAHHDRKDAPESAQCEWFDIDGKPDARQVRTLAGPWSPGVDADKVEIELNGRLVPIEWAESLLESGDDILIARSRSDYSYGGQIITVANGSFLLNLPLVNHEHRRLAGRLVAAVGPARKQVAFLQSGAGGPPILDKEPAPPQFNALDILGVWPLGGILLHLAALGIIFAFACWPIFGRPAVPPASSASDFGKHVTALGKLLARTRDRAYAEAKLAQWQTGRSTELGSRNAARGTKMAAPEAPSSDFPVPN